MSGDPIKVAVIEGQHPFDVPAWQRLFESMDGIEFYLQSFENWCWDWGQCRDWYDTTVFYNFHQEMPPEEDNMLRQCMEYLGENGKGIVVLHHAILAFPKEKTWSDLVGIGDRAFDYHVGQEITVHSVNDSHPISKGIEPSVVVDETYTMADADPGCEVLFTVDHPKSMKTVGWTKTHKNSKVFNFQLGHDNVAWENPAFREILLRGIQWTAGRLT